MTTVAEQLAQSIHTAARAGIPPAMRTMAQRLVLDIAGLCVAARRSDYVAATIAGTHEPGNCTVIGYATKMDVASAALINGTASHGEDFDDTYEGGPVHSGVVIVPAVLAAAERHGLSGQAVLNGIAIGCEVMCRLCAVKPKALHHAGFHPTAVFGAMGAAAAVAAAMKLTPAQTVSAFGIAGSMAGGIIEYLAEGTWTKRMHPGWAAQSGYRAARLAEAGFTGPRTVFEGTHGLFYAFAHANADECNWPGLLDGFGARWASVGIAFKAYACGTMTHPYIDCARKLAAVMKTQGLSLDAINEIECETSDGYVHRLWEPLANKQLPPNAYAAKFSVPYAIAVAMIFDDAGLPQYTEAMAADPRVQALAKKIHYIVDPQNPYPARYTGHLRILFADGKIIEGRQPHLRGGVAEPLSDDDITQKFFANCAYGGMSKAQADAAKKMLDGIFSTDKIDLTSLRFD